MKRSRNLKSAMLFLAMTIAFAISSANAAFAGVEFDQNVTPDVIFGAGNDNGAFTTDRRNGIELAIRAKLRFNASGLPENTFNSNGNGTYSFPAVGLVAPFGFGFAQPPTTTPIWNFEWSVNTDQDGTTGVKLDDLTYELGLDFDPSTGTDFLKFDNITPSVAVPFYDHAIGDNSTPNGGGTEAVDNTTYVALLAGNNVAQNSWSYEFFNDAPFDGFDPTENGTYAIYLLAKNSDGDVLARVNIQVLVGNGQPAPDHVQCYDVKRATKLYPRPKVSLNDQFAYRDNVRVNKRAELYCTPVDKNSEGISNLDNTWTCYKVKSSRQKQEVVIDNQFGEQTLRLKKSEMLCVPSKQLSTRPLGNNGGDDDDDDEDDD